MEGPFAEFLARRRDELNQKFLVARHAWPQLEPAPFLAHLRETLAPIVTAVARDFVEKTDVTALALYDLALELVGRQLLGPTARQPILETAWRELLPKIPRLVSRDPRRVAGSITNALYQLAATPGARPAEWLTAMEGLATQAAGIEELLACGRIAAWRAGLARQRLAALAAAEKLPPALAAAALGLPGATGCTAEALGKALERLATDPWLAPEAAAAEAKPARSSLAIVARAGAFRGFGGEFLRPPLAAVHAGQIVVVDGESTWALSADLFGADFVRTTITAPRPELKSTGFKIDRQGNLEWQGQKAAFPELVDATSAATDGTTLAVTLATSHHVYLVARRAP